MHPLILFYLCRMCQCELHAVLWSLIEILMRFLTAKPSSTAGFYSALGVSVTIFADPVFDDIKWRVLSVGSRHFYLPKLLVSFLSSTVFLFSSFFLYVGIVGRFFFN